MSLNGTAGKPLTPRQRRAIAALLSARSVGEAAIAAQVNRRTIHRWMASPIFRQELIRAGDDLIEEATRRLQGGQQKALDVLEEVMASEKLDQRRLASQAWLELVLRWHEQTALIQRLTRLEDLQNGETQER